MGAGEPEDAVVREDGAEQEASAAMVDEVACYDGHDSDVQHDTRDNMNGDEGDKGDEGDVVVLGDAEAVADVAADAAVVVPLHKMQATGINR